MLGGYLSWQHRAARGPAGRAPRRNCSRDGGSNGELACASSCKHVIWQNKTMVCNCRHVDPSTPRDALASASRGPATLPRLAPPRRPQLTVWGIAVFSERPRTQTGTRRGPAKRRRPGGLRSLAAAPPSRNRGSRAATHPDGYPAWPSKRPLRRGRCPPSPHPSGPSALPCKQRRRGGTWRSR
jgi:hypothetical protein